MNANALLVYGYDLGVDFGFKSSERPQWLKDADPYDVADAAVTFLLHEYGLFTREHAAQMWDPAASSEARQRRRARRESRVRELGVRVFTYGPSSDPGFMIGVHSYEVSSESSMPVRTLTVPPSADRRLWRALQMLGIVPAENNPGWHLAVHED